MAESGFSIDFTINAKQTLADVKKLERSTQRAVMWAVREAGRLAKREMKAAAPRYTGTDPRIKKGRLRTSIRVSSRIGNEGDGVYVNKVGPKRDPLAHLYAYKAEAESGYAEAGAAIVDASASALTDAAISRAIKKV